MSCWKYIYKNVYYTFLFVLFAFVCTAQEQCYNGIDDDNDGLIDLNDTIDCTCSTSTSTVITSLISNPSFENFSNCPFTFSQISYATGWLDGTQGTADFLNTCGFTTMAALNSSLTPFPDGNGCAGGFFQDTYKEYIKTCLSVPLLAGTSYNMNFYVASMPMNGTTNGLCNNGAIYYNAPVNITLYGSTSCTNTILPTSGCPSSFSPAWNILGSVSYTPVASAWNMVSITFTPSANISSIMLGAPCSIPASYSQVGSCGPYFLFDNLILNETSLFSQPTVNILSTGSSCSNNLLLTANVTPSFSPGFTYQWYLNGVALIGATSNSYNVPSGTSSFGNYQVSIHNGSYCNLSAPFQVNSSQVFVSVNSPTICNGNSTLLNATGASTYSWSNGAATSSVSISPSITTNYTVIGYSNGCSDTVITTITVNQTPTLSVSSDITITTGTSATLTASSDGSNFTWSPSQSLSCISCISPVASPSVTTQYCVSTSINTCTNSACVIVQVESPCNGNSDYSFATAFTPNGDGINDEFCLQGWKNCISDLYIAIYNRWGERVFYSEDISFCWDGKYLNQSLNSDVFVFYIKAKTVDGEQISKKGNLSLIK